MPGVMQQKRKRGPPSSAPSKGKVSAKTEDDAAFTEMPSQDIPVAGTSRTVAADDDDESEEEDEEMALIQPRLLAAAAAAAAAAPHSANTHTSKASKKAEKQAGAFHSMGLDPLVLKAVLKKGYKIPTPIQRKAIPVLMEGRDAVAMARTGSGKTAAFLLPLLQKLKTHSAKVGARAIVLSPLRELALQTYKFAKELGKFTDLRFSAFVGGESMDEQFKEMTKNPDVIIATPGRFMHLCLEMELTLSSVQYIVFDEADRLFELGFEMQLHEIMHKLPANRQTVLFSATLPKLLVNFAKAGLQDPLLIRLDVDTKISPDLNMHFLIVKSADKEALLLWLLKHAIPSTESSILFVSTKHHVDYLNELLTLAGHSVTYIYGALDSMARTNNLAAFRQGSKKILIVTDVASRGIDIPLLNNVINYDLPDQSKVFLHRVGRAARAGAPGQAFNLVSPDEVGYILDLQLFLGRSLSLGKGDGRKDIVLGTTPQNVLDQENEYFSAALVNNTDLAAAKKSSTNAFKLYMKTRSPCSTVSHARARTLLAQDIALHDAIVSIAGKEAVSHASILSELKNFRPSETVFEISRKLGKANTTEQEVMLQRRRETSRLMEQHQKKRKRQSEEAASLLNIKGSEATPKGNEAAQEEEEVSSVFDVMRDDDLGIERAQKKRTRTEKATPPSSYKDEAHYVAYRPADDNTEKGYNAVNTTQNLATAAYQATLDLTNTMEVKKNTAPRWDPKKKKFIRPTVGRDNKAMMRTESGLRVPASFKSGAYAKWQQQHGLAIPSVGEQELGESDLARVGARKGGQRGQRLHHREAAAAQLDPLHINYERKKRQLDARKKKVTEDGTSAPSGARPIKSELKSRDKIVKERREKEKRRAKTGRHHVAKMKTGQQKKRSKQSRKK